MTQIETRLNDQLEVEALRERVIQLSNEHRRIRHQIRCIGTANTLIGIGFSEDESMTPEDHLRCNALEGLDEVQDRLIQLAAEVIQQREAAKAALIKRQRELGLPHCDSCGASNDDEEET